MSKGKDGSDIADDRSLLSWQYIPAGDDTSSIMSSRAATDGTGPATGDITPSLSLLATLLPGEKHFTFLSNGPAAGGSNPASIADSAADHVDPTPTWPAMSAAIWPSATLHAAESVCAELDVSQPQEAADTSQPQAAAKKRPELYKKREIRLYGAPGSDYMVVDSDEEHLTYEAAHAAREGKWWKDPSKLAESHRLWKEWLAEPSQPHAAVPKASSAPPSEQPAICIAVTYAGVQSERGWYRHCTKILIF